MGWSNDPELRELFEAELTERLGRLRSGAIAMQNGTLGSTEVGTMVREGHTIKGTGRVMGFDLVSDAGLSLEDTWRAVQDGDLDMSPGLGAALLDLVEAIAPAVTEGADESEVAQAIDRLEAARAGGGETPPAPSAGAAPLHHGAAVPYVPDKASRSEGPDGARARLSHEMMASSSRMSIADSVAGVPGSSGDDLELAPATTELGGLLGALETWASGETVLVSAGRLYRLINHVASVRLDLEAIAESSSRLVELDGGTGDAVATLAAAFADLERAGAVLEEEALNLAAVPLTDITNTLPQLVRYLSKKTGKNIRFETLGDEVSIDRQIVDRLTDPLRQLLVNAIEHGIEEPRERERAGKPLTATLALRASVKDHQLEIQIQDDGRGIDWDDVRQEAEIRGLIDKDSPADEEALRAFLFTAGFTTAVNRSELVGDGTGLAAVAEAIEAMYGSLRLETEQGSGTQVTLTVPTSRALQRAVLVESGGQTWGIPEASVDEILPLEAVVLHPEASRTEMDWKGGRIQLESFGRLVGLPEPSVDSHVVVVSGPVGAVGLAVEEVLGSRDVAAKELGPLLAGPDHLTGAALLGAGEVVLLVDANRLAERARVAPTGSEPVGKVLVVDDSPGVRQVVAGALASNGFETTVASSVEEAIVALDREAIDAVVVDFAMPGGDGISLIAEVRERFAAVPVIMFSSVATAEDQARARAAGVDAFFDKSDFREGGLADALRTLVATRNRRRGDQA